MRYAILVFTLLVFSSSCKSTKMLEALAEHRRAIVGALGDNVSPREKLDVAASTLLSVLNESLSIGPVKKSVRHIDQFNKANQKDLDKLFDQIGSWIGGMSKNERNLFYLSLATKPYTLELIRTIPKVEKKISRKIGTYLLFSRLLKFVKL